jgi:hypothetical protein
MSNEESDEHIISENADRAIIEFALVSDVSKGKDCLEIYLKQHMVVVRIMDYGAKDKDVGYSVIVEAYECDKCEEEKHEASGLHDHADDASG